MTSRKRSSALRARNALRERKLEEATENWAREVRDRAYVEFRAEDQ